MYRIHYKRPYFNERLIYTLKKPFRLYKKLKKKEKKVPFKPVFFKIGIFYYKRVYNNLFITTI